MANIRGVELAREIYGLEDETARTTSQTATNTANTAKNAVETVETTVEQLASRVTTNEEAIENIANNWVNISSQCTNVYSGTIITLYYNSTLKQLRGNIRIPVSLNNNQTVLTLPKTPRFETAHTCAALKAGGIAVPACLSVSTNKSVKFVELSYSEPVPYMECFIDVLTSD